MAGPTRRQAPGFLLQSRHLQLGDSERRLFECVVTLEWLVTHVIWQLGSQVLLMHRATVLYQWSCLMKVKASAFARNRQADHDAAALAS